MEENKENVNEQVVEESEKDTSVDLEKNLEELKKENEETTDRLRRIMAEFDNFKKRNIKEKEMQYSSILADIISSFLPVVDNLEKALQVETKDENYKQGIELVLKQFMDVLSSFGVKKIETVGKEFNPELHDAVSHVEDSELGAQVIKEEFRAGYIVGDKVIRHSMVVVAN